MNYILELRQFVGHSPLIMVGASALVFNSQNSLLLQCRSDNGAWSTLGGAMEPGETFEQTARREAYEEAGIQLGELEFFMAISGLEFFYEYPNHDQVYNVGIVYAARQACGKPRSDSEENFHLAYFPVESLPEPISPPEQPVLSELVRRWKAGWRPK